MKRALALILCAVMVVLTLAGCTTLKKNDETGEYDKGAIIPMYIGTEMISFDPTVAYLNDSNVKILSMLYEGLTDIDENGKLQLSLIDKYEIKEDPKLNEYKMTITLKHTKWSDGRELQASDVVYTFRRILDVNFECEAACLLFDIKNARAIKDGHMTIDDLGATAPETYKVEIAFEKPIDYTQFLRNLSSPALVPLREDIVERSADWAKKPASIATSGPFTLKLSNYEGILRLERSNYYFLDTEKDEYMDKYVIPYRLESNYSKSTGSYLSDIRLGKDKNRVFYTSELPLDQRKTYINNVTMSEKSMSTHAYYFNLNKPLFQDARVRQALSLAVDRDYIANEIVVYADPATGLVPSGVTNGSVGSSFREAGGKVIETSANMERAKQLLSEAGVSGGEIYISYDIHDDVSAAIAQYVKEVWTELGFQAKALPVSPSQTSDDEAIYNDNFHNLYSVDAAKGANSWDVLAVDYQMLSEEAFSALAPFAVGFSGNGADMTDLENDYPAIGHVTGYASEEYDALVEAAYKETDAAKRAEKLHEAEKKLMEDMPVMPLVFNKNAYLVNGVISGITVDYYGVANFKRVKMSDYMDWKQYFEETTAPAA